MTVIRLTQTVSIAAFLFFWWRFAEEDIRGLKIKNAMLKRAFLFVGVFYLILAVNSFLGYLSLTRIYHNPFFYQNCALHIVLAALLGISFWVLKIWPAGDAKLFVYTQMFPPLMAAQSPLLPFRLSLTSLINIFITCAIFFVLQAFIWSWWRRMKPRLSFYRSIGAAGSWEHLKKEFSLPQWFDTLHELGVFFRDSSWRSTLHIQMLKLISGILLLAVLQRSLGRTLAGGQWERFGPISAMMAAYFIGELRHKTPPWAAVLFGCFAVGVAVVDARIYGPGLLSLVSQLFMFALVMGAATHFVTVFIKNDNAVLLALPCFGFAGVLAFFLGGKEWLFWVLGGILIGSLQPLIQFFRHENVLMVEASSIAPYMVLAPASVDWLKKDPEFFEEYFSVLYPDGLTPEQAGKVRERCFNEGVRQIAAAKTIPFAFWIFLGTALTGLIQGAVLSLLGR